MIERKPVDCEIISRKCNQSSLNRCGHCCHAKIYADKKLKQVITGKPTDKIIMLQYNENGIRYVYKTPIDSAMIQIRNGKVIREKSNTNS